MEERLKKLGKTLNDAIDRVLDKIFDIFDTEDPVESVGEPKTPNIMYGIQSKRSKKYLKHITNVGGKVFSENLDDAKMFTTRESAKNYMNANNMKDTYYEIVKIDIAKYK